MAVSFLVSACIGLLFLNDTSLLTFFFKHDKEHIFDTVLVRLKFLREI